MQMMEELVEDIDAEKTRTIRRSRRLVFRDSSRIIVVVVVICAEIAGVVTHILARDCVFYLLA